MSNLFRQLCLRFRSVFQKGRVEQELDGELQYHLDRQIAERLAEGHAPEEARYAALRAMGAITQNKEECRDMRAVRWMEDMCQDFRFGVRALGKNPGFTDRPMPRHAYLLTCSTRVFNPLFVTSWFSGSSSLW